MLLPIIIRKHTRSIPKYMADAIGAAAAAEVARSDEGLETEEIMLRGTTLVLPKEMVDALVAALGIGSSGAPAPEAPVDEAPPPDPNAPPPAPGEGPRMDAKVLAAIRTVVREEIVAHARETARTDALTARATKLLAGKAPTGLDLPGLMAAAIERCDSTRANEVKALATAARKGDLRAAGMLEGLLAGAGTMARADSLEDDEEDEPEVREDAVDHIAAAAKQIHEGQADQATRRGDAAPSANFDSERERARQRKLNGGKPPKTTPDAPAARS